MQDPINTAFPEYSPVISANGNELYFTSRRGWENKDQKKYMNPVDNSFPEDIFLSVKGYNYDWSEPKRLEMCDPFVNEASVSLTANMNRLFVYSDSVGNGNIFFSEFSKDQFNSIESLGQKKLNTKFWETHFVISQDSSLIVFSSERKRGEGGRDLWKLVKGDDGNWSKPINMGPEINTPEDEDAPFLTLDGKTLYYSTNGRESMGGFDIMRSDIKDGEWQKGENLGYPINSTGDDVFYSITYDGKDAYFSSFRLRGKGEKDIYHVSYENPIGDKVITLDGSVIDITEDAEEIDLIVSLRNLTDNTEVSTVVKRNEFFEVLKHCKDYELVMTNALDNNVLLKETFKTNCEEKPEYLEKRYFNGQYWINGILADIENNAPISNANIELINDVTGELIANLNPATEGNFASPKFANLKPGDSMNVSFRVTAEGYLPGYFDLDTLLSTTGKIDVSYFLQKEEKIDNIEEILASYIIYYDFDKSEIRNSEVDIMDKVVALMNSNPTLKIKLKSYTDCRGTAEYNKALSERRATSSVNYIRSKISNPDRITSEGMGESGFVFDCECNENNVHGNCTIEQHQKNRRTTFELIER